MPKHDQLTPQQRRNLLIAVIAGGIFIFALAFYTTSQDVFSAESGVEKKAP